MLSFKSNQLLSIPDASLPPSLGWLILTDNRLPALPPSIGKLKGLRKCMLTNNRIEELPAEILSCRDLELIRLADNRLSRVPDGFFSLPKLSWAGLAGNPCVAAPPGGQAVPPPRYLDLARFEIHEQLGAGGGGFVSRATWTGGDEEGGEGAASLRRGAEVAIKVFRDAGVSGAPGRSAHAVLAWGRGHVTVK